MLLFLLVLPNLQGQKISVQNGNWGTANARDISCVLESTSQIFLPYLLFLKKKKISVYPRPCQRFITTVPIAVNIELISLQKIEIGASMPFNLLMNLLI